MTAEPIDSGGAAEGFDPARYDPPRYDPPRFESAAAERIVAHLNRCHRLENLRLARLATTDAGLGGDFLRVWIAGLDSAGVDFLAETYDGPLVLRVEFGWPAASLAEAGEELRRLYRAACRSPG